MTKAATGDTRGPESEDWADYIERHILDTGMAQKAARFVRKQAEDIRRLCAHLDDLRFPLRKATLADADRAVVGSKPLRPRPYVASFRFGIINPDGNVWTPATFDTEYEALQHLRRYWENKPEQVEKFTVVKVRVTVEVQRDQRATRMSGPLKAHDLLGDGDVGLLYRLWIGLQVLRAVLVYRDAPGVDLADDYIRRINQLHPEFARIFAALEREENNGRT